MDGLLQDYKKMYDGHSEVIYLHSIPVPVNALLLISELKTRHFHNIEERLPNHSGGRVIHISETCLHSGKTEADVVFTPF